MKIVSLQTINMDLNIFSFIINKLSIEYILKCELFGNDNNDD